jgi:hypothetical protein
MRAIRFFTIPTLLGWLAAYLTCCGLHVVAAPSGDVARDYALALVAGGVLIVLPSYLTVILPLSFLDWRGSKMGRPISVGWYVAGLLVAAFVVTGISVQYGFTTSAWSAGRLDLFCIPFIPFVVVVVAVTKRMLPREERA